MLADMENLQILLKETVDELKLLKDALNESRGSSEERQRKSAQVRARLEQAGQDYKNQMNQLLSDMGIADLLTEEEIKQHLTEAFNKFDEDHSGEMGHWEF